MAKKSDQLAGGFETENTGGVLSGLLADEEHLDRRAMFRLGTWGVVSVGAVIIAVLANQSAIKTRRDEAAALDLTRQSQQIQSVARESQNETRRLASAIDTLNGDRDRLYARLTTIEQGLDSVTGAIAKQKVATPATPTSATPAAASATPAPAPQPIAQTAAPDPAPAVAPVTTNLPQVTTSVAPVMTSVAPVATPATDKPRTEAKKPSPPANAAVAATTPATAPPTPSTPAPMMASKSLMAPPDAAAGKLIEPEPPAKAVAATPAASPLEPTSTVSAAAPAAPVHAPDVASAKPASESKPASDSKSVLKSKSGSDSKPASDSKSVLESKSGSNSKPAHEKVATAEPPPSAPAPLAVKRTEFGVDVGGANSVSGLRALWRGLLKSRSNAPLAALEPIIVVKERDNGLGMQLRLVAGPLGDAAAAARICARLAEGERPCETTVFDGQRLALKAGDGPTTTETISAKPEKSSTEKSSAEKSGPAAATAERPAPEKPVATKPGANRYYHRRSYSSSKRAAAAAAAAVVEEPPKKPETSSSISSFFSSRIHPQ